jgi:hypothetical protein
MTRIQVLLLAAFVLAPLFSLLMRAVKRRLEGEAPRGLGPEAPSIPVRAGTSPAPTAGSGAVPRATSRGRAGGMVASGMVATSAAAGGQVPFSLGRHGEVRRGIVLMTVLGTCRALEAPGA